MAWTYESDRFASGEVVDPRPVMRLFNRLAGEINGHLDRDNVPRGLLTKDELEVGALREDGSVNGYTPIQLFAYQGGSWTDIGTGATATPTITSDSIIRVVGCVNYSWFVGSLQYNSRVQFRLMINGAQVAISGWLHNAHAKSSAKLIGISPVPAGPSTITLQIRTYGAVWTHIDDIRNGITTTGAYTDNPSYAIHPMFVLAAGLTYTIRKR